MADRPTTDVTSLRTARCAHSLVVPLALLLAAAAGCRGGCGGCGDEHPDVAAPQSPVPDGRAALTRGFAERFPAGTHGILVARGFAEVSSAFQTIKGSIRSFFDLGAVESEIRNTFGVDLARHVTFREVGIAYEGGFCLGTVSQQPVVAFYLLDPEPFVQRANVVLRRQPFNLRAPVRTDSIGQATVHLYSRRLNQPAEFAVVIDRGFGFLISRVNASIDIEDVARQLAETTPETSIAAHPDFDAQVDRFDEYPGFAFIDTGAATSFYRERYSDQLSESSALALEKVQGSITSIAGGALLDGMEVRSLVYVAVTEETSELAEGIEAQPESPPHLERFILPSTFAAVRLGADLAVLLETFLRFQGDELQQIVRDALQNAGEAIGASITEDAFGALSGQAVVMINRLAPISLMRAESPADYADAVDLMAVFQLADRHRAEELLDALVETSEGNYERVDLGGDAVRYATGRGELGFGNAYLRDNLLVIAAERMRRIAEATPTEGTGAGLGELVGAARELMTAESATGLFLIFERLEPIALLLNYPQAVRDLLSFLDTLVVSLHKEGNGLFVRGSLTLRATE